MNWHPKFLEPCDHCLSLDVVVIHEEHHFRAKCTKCGAVGPGAATPLMASTAWRVFR